MGNFILVTLCTIQKLRCTFICSKSEYVTSFYCEVIIFLQRLNFIYIDVDKRVVYDPVISITVSLFVIFTNLIFCTDSMYA